MRFADVGNAVDRVEGSANRRAARGHHAQRTTAQVRLAADGVVERRGVHPTVAIGVHLDEVRTTETEDVRGHGHRIMRLIGHEHAPRAPVKAVVTGRRDGGLSGAQHAHEVPVRAARGQRTCACGHAQVLTHSVEHRRLNQARQRRNFIGVHRGVRGRRDQFSCKTFGRQPAPQGVHESRLIGPHRLRKVGADVTQHTVETGTDERQIKVGGFAKAGWRQVMPDSAVLGWLQVCQDLGQNRLEEARVAFLHGPRGPLAAFEGRPSPAHNRRVVESKCNMHGR